MSRISLAVLVALLGACTERNPNICCTDADQCAELGIDPDSCGTGKVCRGNSCVVEYCGVSANCDAAAQYCVMEAAGGRCEEACTMDDQCPGFGQTAAQTFCESGACVECRTADDCDVMAPVCDPDGSCRRCTAHTDCDSGVCNDDGTCVDPSLIAYVAPTGTPTADCTPAAPCSTLARAYSLSPDRVYIVIDSSQYTSNAAISPPAIHWLIGRGPTKPLLRRSTPGPVVEVGQLTSTTQSFTNQLRLENLDVGGATALDGYNYGAGVEAVAFGTTLTLVVKDVATHDNAEGGIHTSDTDVTLDRVVSSNNGYGANLIDSTVDIDRSTFIANHDGLNLDGGNFKVANSIVARSVGFGIDLNSGTPTASAIDFVTLVDNASIMCAAGTPMRNSILARNGTNTCSPTTSIILDGSTDISPLHFKSANAAPYDYHLTAGSSAIDAGATSTIDHDIDGDARPQGAAPDVGADEFKP